MAEDPGPPPPRRAPRTPDMALRRALQHRMNDRHLPADNDTDPPSSEPNGAIGLSWRSIPKWVPNDD